MHKPDHDANISVAIAALDEKKTGISVAQAQLAQVEANLTKAKLDYDRDRQQFEAAAMLKT